MALRRTMPARDPQRAQTEPQHSRTYAGSQGGYTTDQAAKPVPGTPKGGK
ncbi:hypothetical protein PV518_17730 [Streptomyces sp. ND04-05B]|nr:hypothetical protein [Streptomyces sp. ND04-05B]MDX3064001.1 hypothetical protein [Streptomyces sp. ND04-05B]